MALDRRWFVVVAVPVCAYVVGVAALPRPKGVAEEQRALDRSKLMGAVTTTATTPTSPAEASLGASITLRGADLPDRALSRGARLPVKLHFRCDDDVEGDWQVFLHIDAQGGGFRIHGDHWPVRGQYKTGHWQRGEFIVDSWEGSVPMNAPAGVYDVWTGLYQGDERMEVTTGNPKLVDAEDRVRVGQITVE